MIISHHVVKMKGTIILTFFTSKWRTGLLISPGQCKYANPWAASSSISILFSMNGRSQIWALSWLQIIVHYFYVCTFANLMWVIRDPPSINSMIIILLLVYVSTYAQSLYMWMAIPALISSNITIAISISLEHLVLRQICNFIHSCLTMLAPLSE